MRIEANIPAVQNTVDTKVSTHVQKAPKANVASARDSYPELAHKPEQELTIDEKNWIKLIERANMAISGANRTFEYSIHEKTKQIMVKVIDSDTNTVIREIPPENILNLVAKFWEMAGIVVDERR